MKSDSPLSLASENEPSIRTLRSLQITVILTATLLHGIFLSKAKPLQSANDRSRWCTIWSLVERGTFQIDEIRQRPGWDTIDMVHVDGHFYSTKPPLLTTLVAGITWCVQRCSGWSLNDHLQSVTFVVLLIINLIPFFVSLLAWMAILERISQSAWTRCFGVIIAAFGTLTTPFLMTLNNHTVATASAIIAIYAVCQILASKTDSAAIWPYLLCGVAVGWTMVNELPAAALGFFLFVVCYRISPKKACAFFVPPALVPVLALIVTNFIATGSWKPTYADYGSEKYRFVIDGVPSYWMNPQGVDRNIDSWWVYLLHCTVGHHGIFSLTPISLLALGGWLVSVRKGDRVLRPLLVTGGLTCLIVIAFYVSRTQNYNYGGVSCGLRWAVWLIPLWMVAAVPMLDAMASATFGRAIATILVLASIYSAWQPIDNPWRQPWIFQWMEARGWIDYSEEREHLPRQLWTWFDSLPESVGDESPWVEFHVAQPNSTSRLVRLTGRTQFKGQPNELFQLEVRETFADGALPPRIRTMQIVPKKFQDGAPPAEFLTWSDPNVTSATQQDDLAFVRGLPRKVSYELRSIRYLKTALRTEALRCKHAAAHVAFSAREGDTPIVYRCDTWLSDDVPFGVARVEFHVNQYDDASVLFHERWTVHDCWPKVRPYENP